MAVTSRNIDVNALFSAHPGQVQGIFSGDDPGSHGMSMDWLTDSQGNNYYRRPDGGFTGPGSTGSLTAFYDAQGNFLGERETGRGSLWDNTFGKYGLGQAAEDVVKDQKLMMFLGTAAGGAYASSVAGGAGTAAAGTGAAEVGAGSVAAPTATAAAPAAAAAPGGITATQAVGGAGAASSALGGGGGGDTGGGFSDARYSSEAGIDYSGGTDSWYDQIVRQYGEPAAEWLRAGVAKNPGMLATIGDLVGGYMGSDAAKDAAQMQIDATKLGIDEVRRQYDQTRADQLPWMEAGKRALGTLEGQLPELTSKFTANDLTNDPGYQFQLDQGLDAITAAGRAGGSLDSGATLKALLEYGQGHAGKFYNEAFNRDQVSKSSIYNMLSGLSGTGQTTAQQLATTGAGASQSIAGLLGQGANAAASGEVGSTNAWINALNNTSNRTQQSSWMDALFNNRSGSGGGWSNFWGG